jgi:hypothetical protein
MLNRHAILAHPLPIQRWISDPTELHPPTKSQSSVYHSMAYVSSPSPGDRHSGTGPSPSGASPATGLLTAHHARNAAQLPIREAYECNTEGTVNHPGPMLALCGPDMQVSTVTAPPLYFGELHARRPRAPTDTERHHTTPGWSNPRRDGGQSPSVWIKA